MEFAAFRTLNADEIEVKVKKVTENGAIALLYKTARTDMDLLDETVGKDAWSCSYEEIKGNLYCTISIKNEAGEWIPKQDCGIESRADEDGNQKKGEASDAFKRAGFRWGIGRELYSSPFVFLPVKTVKDGARWKLQDTYASFSVGRIEYDAKRRICGLSIVDDKDHEVFCFPRKKENPQNVQKKNENGKKKYEDTPSQQELKREMQKPNIEPNVYGGDANEMARVDLIAEIYNIGAQMGSSADEVDKLILEAGKEALCDMQYQRLIGAKKYLENIAKKREKK